MDHPYYHTDSYVFVWIFILPFFYIVFLPTLIIVYGKIYKFIKIGFAIIIAGWLVFSLIFADFYIFLFSITGALFPVILRYCQSFTAHFQGIKQKFYSVIVYIVLPFLCTFFWPAYLVAPALIEYWQNRPDSECKQNGRLVALSEDINLRIYPISKYPSFWIRSLAPKLEDYIFNTAQKNFCRQFSASQPTLIDSIGKINIDLNTLCQHPVSKKMASYCENLAIRQIKFEWLEFELIKKDKNTKSPWQQFQDDLNNKYIYTKEEKLNYEIVNHHTELIENLKFDNQVQMFKFFDHYYNVITVPNPGWLPSVTEPLVINCPTDYDLKCYITHDFTNNWEVSYLYSFTINYKNNPDNDDQNSINQKLDAAKLAYQIIESVIEEMQVNH